MAAPFFSDLLQLGNVVLHHFFYQVAYVNSPLGSLDLQPGVQLRFNIDRMPGGVNGLLHCGRDRQELIPVLPLWVASYQRLA